MGKRLGRKRLFALNKTGESVTKTAGAGISDSLGNFGAIRDGSMITTDIHIDLGNATSPAYAFSGSSELSGAAATTPNGYRIIGTSGSSTATDAGVAGENVGQANAQFMFTTTAVQGVVSAGELICVETPTGGGSRFRIGVFYGPAISGSGRTLGGAAALVAPVVQTKGLSNSFDLDADELDGMYLYLGQSGSTAADSVAADAAYTAGKFILRLYGYPVFDDIA